MWNSLLHAPEPVLSSPDRSHMEQRCLKSGEQQASVAKGGGLFEFQTPIPPPFPPPDPPKVFEPVFLQFEILGEGSAPKAPNFFFLPFLRGYSFFIQCVYTQNTQTFVENSKMFEKHRKFFDP